MIFSWLLVPCALLFCIYALLWLHGRRARILLAGLPTYPSLPFVGNVHHIMGSGLYIFQQLQKISKVQEATGLPFYLWIGPKPVIFVSDPEDVKAVTNAFVEKPYYYGFARDWVGNGLVTAPVSIWKKNVKQLAGSFTGSIVAGYQEVFNAQAQKLVNKLRGEVGGDPFNILHKYLAHTTLEAICQTALGVPRISDSIVTYEYYSAFNQAFEYFLRRGKNIVLHLDFIYRLTPSYREFMKCVDIMQKVSDSIMYKRMEERKELKKKVTLPQEPENDKIRFKAFLDILLDLQDVDTTLTDKYIRNEVDTIIVGGQETVAATLFFTFLVLGSKPWIQEKLHAELKEIFGDTDRPVEKEDLARMTYCESVLLETLRMYPPIPVVMREADRDLPIKSCTIPKGTGCAVNILGAGRSKRVWGPDAEEYRPERWMESDLARTHAGSFFAFSFGKRACIGKRYAMAIMITVLGHCIRKFELSSDLDSLQLKIDVTMKSHSGDLIKVRLRE